MNEIKNLSIFIVAFSVLMIGAPAAASLGFTSPVFATTAQSDNDESNNDQSNTDESNNDQSNTDESNNDQSNTDESNSTQTDNEQPKRDNKYANHYSIVRKVYAGENFVESHSITVNKKNLFQIKDQIDMVLNECM